MPREYQHLKAEEREKINLFGTEGKSLREIGRILERSDATIGRELKRNAAPLNKGYYLAHKAEIRYESRQSQAHSRLRLKNESIRGSVSEMLNEKLSPELIAGRLSLENKGYTISH